MLMLTGILLAASTISCAGPELTFAQKSQDALDRGLENYGGMGLSVAIIIPGQESWVGASGVSHENIEITPDTLFSAGSITKTFTAATILKLAEEETLSLDDPIQLWLPEFTNIDGTITIRQLLNHTGGIFNITENPEYWQAMLSEPALLWAPEEVVSEFTLQPYFPQGVDWHYSSTGYILLRMIIQEATGNELTTEYRERFWTPLDLDMFLVPEDELQGNVAHGWFDLDGDGSYDDIPLLASFYSGLGGGAFCTAEELAKWAKSLYHERKVLNEQSYQQMFDFHSPTPGEPLVEGYGLGVVRFAPELFNDLEVWGHGGNAPGYAAGCLYLPQYGVSIGIMTNTEGGEAMPTINDLLDIIVSSVETIH